MKKITRLFIFMLILIGLSGMCLSHVKNRNAHIDEYISKLTNADVLVVGSSHSYVNLNGAVLWDQYGIPSACIGQGEQPICMSYYTLKSALRYGKPKLVILETYMAVVGDTYNNYSDKYANSLLGFSFFKNLDCRIEASKFLVNESKLEFVLGFPVFHSDYAVPKSPRTFTAGYELAFFQNLDGQTKNRESSLTEQGRVQLSETVNEYLLKTVALCREENIDLLLLVTPYQAPTDHIQIFNSIKELADKEQVEFIDMNSYVEEIGIDLSTEMSDWGHAMVSGAEKNSIWLGNYIMNMYTLEDRRQNEAYAVWDKVYEDYVQQINAQK